MSQQNLFDLTGKVALITGSSRGMGNAIAKRMAEHGANVVITSRKRDACEAVAAEINSLRSEGYGEAMAIPCNIGRKEELQQLVAAVEERWGKVDILVCNAAINPWIGSTLDVEDATFRKVMETNLMGSHWLCQRVLPGMVERQDGRIILITSLSGQTGSRQFGLYGLSKAAGNQMARNLAVEFGRYGIRANAIAPDVHRTDMARSLWDDPAAASPYLKRNPSGRFGEPDEIAGTAIFLASRAGGNVNGQVIAVDGGYSINYDFI